MPIDPVPATNTSPTGSPAPATSAISASLTISVRWRRPTGASGRGSSPHRPLNPRRQSPGHPQPDARSLSSPDALTAPPYTTTLTEIGRPPFVLAHGVALRRGMSLSALACATSAPTCWACVRIVVRPLPAHHARLLPHPSLGAVVGHLLHHRRLRDQHADLRGGSRPPPTSPHDVPPARCCYTIGTDYRQPDSHIFSAASSTLPTNYCTCAGEDAAFGGHLPYYNYRWLMASACSPRR